MRDREDSLLGGHVIATFAVAAGVGAAMAHLPRVLGVLTALGSGYLMWLGLGTFRSAAAKGVAATAHTWTPVPTMQQALTGLAVSGLNPKVLLLFLSLLPQFTDSASSWPLSVQLLALGTVHVISCAVVYMVVGMGARRMLGARPSAARLVNRFSGVSMMAIGTFLLLKQATT